MVLEHHEADVEHDERHHADAESLRVDQVGERAALAARAVVLPVRGDARGHVVPLAQRARVVGVERAVRAQQRLGAAVVALLRRGGLEPRIALLRLLLLLLRELHALLGVLDLLPLHRVLHVVPCTCHAHACDAHESARTSARARGACARRVLG